MLPIQQILSVLNARGITPEEEETDGPDLPGIGEINEGETVYSTSINDVLRAPGDGDELVSPRIAIFDDPRGRDWWAEIEQIIRADGADMPLFPAGQARHDQERTEPPEPHCAWYCPVHFFGNGWGIYIRENCIFSVASLIALEVNWRDVRDPIGRAPLIAQQLLRSAFYVLYLHEQFHHKVESLGFRLLITTGTDRYRLYKRNVYRRAYLSSDCLEESLANAESYRRLVEPYYKKQHEPAILTGIRRYLLRAFPLQPPGYAEAGRFVSDQSYRDGLYRLQSQMLDGLIVPTTPAEHWSLAPHVITSLMDIDDEIYVILPIGARPLFKPASISPGPTVSTQRLVGALTRHHGYQVTKGGKGSHVKLTKPGAPNIHLPGNRPVVSPGVVKQALNAIGGYPLSRLPDLLQGRLA